MSGVDPRFEASDDTQTPVSDPEPGGAGIDGGRSAVPPVLTAVRLHREPRIWTALVTSLLAIFCATVLAGLVTALAVVVDADLSTLGDPKRFLQWFEEYSSRPMGLVVMALPGQSVFLFFAIAAALCSPIPVLQRLGLVRGRLPIRSWPIFAAATPMIGWLSSLLVLKVIGDLGEQLELLNRMINSHQGPFVLVVFLLIAVMPGVGEELLFRGYLQTRLLARLPSGAAIAISSLIFAAAHMDPIHVVAVLPLGIWFGTVAWRTGSVIPAILCHVVNNGSAIVLNRLGSNDAADAALGSAELGIIGVSALALLASIWLLSVSGQVDGGEAAGTTYHDAPR